MDTYDQSRNSNRRYLLSVFEREGDLLTAVRAARRLGLKIIDAYTPYAVHGLDEVMGLKPSRLPWICFALGLAGAALKVWFEFWTTAVDWPLNVGGKPWNSLPAFVPVTFEVMVLFAGVSTAIAFLITRRLYPGRRPKLLLPRITDDRFGLLLEEADATFDVEAVSAMLLRHHAVHVEECLRPELE